MNVGNLNTKIVSFILLMILLHASTASGSSPIWAPEPLSRLIEDGLAHNQEIGSMKSLLRSLEEESVYVSSLTDPKIGIGLLNLPVDSYRFDQEPMTQKQLFISQRFPWFGKLDLKEKQILLKADRLAALLRSKQLEIARKIAAQYYDLEFVVYSLSINEKLRDMLGQALMVAESRYATGRGLQSDILHAQVEISKLEADAIRLNKSRQAATSRILALMNQDASEWLDTFEKRTLFPDFRLTAEKIHRAALKYNPIIHAKKAEIDMSGIGVRLARKDSYPDFDVKLAYGQRDESRTGTDWADFFSASVSMNLPIWKKNRQDKRVSARLSEKKSTQELYNNQTAMLPHRIDVLLAEIKDNREQHALYTQKLIPQTQEWASSALAAYEVGKVEFSTMINARIRVLRSQLQARKIMYGVYKSRAELEELIGIPVLDIVEQQAGDMNHESTAKQ